MNIFKSSIKNIIKSLCYLYLKADNSKKRSYIPASGKILNEKELFNMIEASLDMWLTTGRFNDEFEKKLSKILGVRHVVTTNSGSSANLLAISALTSSKLGKKRLIEGDEVITVAAGFPTTINPIIQNGLVPVFVDIDLGTYNINVEQVEESITPKTKAIFIAHTLGNPFNLDKIIDLCNKHHLWLIEDNCDSLGSRYNGKFTGSFGHISTLSFYPAHHITMGEGGALLTNDSNLYRIIMSYRDWGRDCWCPPGKDDTCKKRFEYQMGSLPYGFDHKYIYSHAGYNLKITDWQAAIGLAQLSKLPFFIQKRKDNFKRLYQGLLRLKEYFILPQIEQNADPSWFGFLITLTDKCNFNKVDLIKHLEASGIGTRQLFAGNVLRQPFFTDSNFKLKIRNSKILESNQVSEDEFKLLPNTDIVMNRTFWIGVWPGITPEEIDYMVAVLDEFVTRSKVIV